MKLSILRFFVKISRILAERPTARIPKMLGRATISMLLLLTAQSAWAAQTCNPNAQYTTDGGRFDTSRNGLVIDQLTDLMWAKCPMGWAVSAAGVCTWTSAGSVDNWEGAINFANNFGLAGYSDWRVPNIKELHSLVEHACIDPAINEDVFPKTVFSSSHWTSTPSSNDPSKTWALNFRTGGYSSRPRSENNRLFLVRGGRHQAVSR